MLPQSCALALYLKMAPPSPWPPADGKRAPRAAPDSLKALKAAGKALWRANAWHGVKLRHPISVWPAAGGPAHQYLILMGGGTVAESNVDGSVRHTRDPPCTTP